MPELPQAQFDGWAKVEVMGHQSHIGYVRTEAYGAAVLFRIDQPELPEREFELTHPRLVNGFWTIAGTKVKRAAVPAVSVLVGAGSIYRIVPCTEAAAMLAIENDERAPLCLVDVPRAGLLESGNSDLVDADEELEADLIDDEEENPRFEHFHSPRFPA